MAFRVGDIQQEVFGAFLASPPKNETLREVERLIDWKVLRAISEPVYKDASRGGVVSIGLSVNHLESRSCVPVLTAVGG